ncbi:hypothetical protein A3715_16000 [Oleiphilus sp. HI0009]|nr:hypothetical protein A3715_16000 [Oleiphilus sp. HI0009]KZY67553.1 hypothetical protein A3739_12445 [Oleiphilus sp. HI0067]KZY70777.1 hypothetical protein A3738_15140 [Oleiphilus sp. HI0066]KZZ57503.1 hypothetical protein A3762_10050 [Oleiphilus sp. HI0125]
MLKGEIETMDILFVDDERMIISALERNLRDSDWYIDYALSGPEALIKLGKRHFDVVVTDMAMPAMTGDRLLREVKELDPEITRIIMSGHADQSLGVADGELAHRWLDKPCDPTYLLQVLQEVEKEKRFN